MGNGTTSLMTLLDSTAVRKFRARIFIVDCRGNEQVIDYPLRHLFIRVPSPICGLSGVCCPICGSVNVQSGCKHKTMPYRCREKECRKKFSVKTGTVMECAKVGYQDWLIGAFLLMTSLKSVSSMKLHRDIGVTQKTAWFLAHRLRAALSQDGMLFAGLVEVDETYVGGKRRNMPKAKRKELDGRNIRFIAIKEGIEFDGQQDLQTKVMIALFGLFAEVERDLISERTKEGLAAAKAVKCGSTTVIQWPHSKR